MHKKADIELQFHWMFIVVAGAVILLFFANLIYKQKSVSEKSISADALVSLEGVLTGSMVSTKTLNFLDFPKEIEISYKDCNTYSTGAFSKPTKTTVLFAPEKISGRNLITWALDWNVPYRVTNFLYLTSNEARYILVDDKPASSDYGLINEIDEEIMPDSITRDVVYYDSTLNTFKYSENNEQIRAKGNYKVRFVFYNADAAAMNTLLIPSDFNELSSLDLTAVNIIPDAADADDRFGTVVFYKYNKLSGFVPYADSATSTKPYIKKEAVIGAIFSENPETYECAMQKAFKKLKYVTEVYSSRTQVIYNYYNSLSPPNRCALPVYNNNQPLYQISLLSESLTESNANDIFGYAYSGSPSLEKQNRALQLKSCPPIY